MLKQFIRVFVMVVILAFALTACGSGKPSDTPAASTSPGVSDTANPSDTSSAGASPSAEASTEPTTSGSATPSASASSSKAASDATTYSGYLVDQKTAATGKDADGNALKKDPKKVSISVLRNSAHVSSGYGIYMMRKDGTYKYYKFDATGSKQVKHYIVDKTKLKSGILIAVRGKLSGSTITVTTVLSYGLK